MRYFHELCLGCRGQCPTLQSDSWVLTHLSNLQGCWVPVEESGSGDTEGTWQVGQFPFVKYQSKQKRDAGWLLKEKANSMEDALNMSLKQDDRKRDIVCEQVKTKPANRGKIPLARIERRSLDLRYDQKGDNKILTLGGFVFKLNEEGRTRITPM